MKILLDTIWLTPLAGEGTMVCPRFRKGEGFFAARQPPTHLCPRQDRVALSRNKRVHARLRRTMGRGRNNKHRDLAPRSNSWIGRPTREITVQAGTSIRIGESESSTKEIPMTTRAAETLTVKTCPDKAGQPDYGEVHAEVFRQIGLEGVQQNDN